MKFKLIKSSKRLSRRFKMNGSIELHRIVMDHRSNTSILANSIRVSSKNSLFLERIKLNSNAIFIDIIFSSKFLANIFISIRDYNTIIHERNLISQHFSILCKYINPNKILNIITRSHRESKWTPFRHKVVI